ncbi:meiotic recombination protein spo11-like [Stylonychia lemnae]|uniref:DNA topoisomerase (ATP-hydrolyzing) n=1 Tax=Stylonychia lemnae TaxID=5949 RepID=A0A078AQU7_STYLE|nr:meiotic recombination protein spo11-like [Stylonychia lemnae]|eukprot:CDW83273.1 meiotic recombination protein spo11-like [Stylonychia lemnae]
MKIQKLSKYPLRSIHFISVKNQILYKTKSIDKLLVILDSIDQHLASHIDKVNKRALYYSLLDNKISSTDELDNYIEEICQILNLHRDDLKIGKGYPDYETKKFVKMLSSIANLPIFYIGDADPYGADIYYQYAFGNQVKQYYFEFEFIESKYGLR